MKFVFREHAHDINSEYVSVTDVYDINTPIELGSVLYTLMLELRGVDKSNHALSTLYLYWLTKEPVPDDLVIKEEDTLRLLNRLFEELKGNMCTIFLNLNKDFCGFIIGDTLVAGKEDPETLEVQEYGDISHLKQLPLLPKTLTPPATNIATFEA